MGHDPAQPDMDEIGPDRHEARRESAPQRLDWRITQKCNAFQKDTHLTERLVLALALFDQCRQNAVAQAARRDPVALQPPRRNGFTDNAFIAPGDIKALGP